jgi:hypothetical protein
MKNGKATWATPGGRKKPVRVQCPSCGWVTERVCDDERIGGFGFCFQRGCIGGGGRPSLLRPTPTRRDAAHAKAKRELQGGPV